MVLALEAKYALCISNRQIKKKEFYFAVELLYHSKGLF